MSAHRYKGILGKHRQALVKDRVPKVAAAFALVYEWETEQLVAGLFADCGVPYHEPAQTGLASGQVSPWQRVALTLAERHVPGFQIGNSKRGRPKRSNHRETLMNMMREVHGNNRSIRQAAKAVATKMRLPNKEAPAIDRWYRRQMDKLKR